MKLLGIFLLLLISSSARRTRRQLYVNDHTVRVLDGQNFADNVENSTKAWLVEFYTSWCGYCQRFAPKWKSLAKDIAEWQDLVRVAVVECSDERNLSICRKYGITSFPTIRYFHENYRYDDNPDNLGQVVEKDYDKIEVVRRNIIDRLAIEQEQGRGLQYPKMEPFKHEEVSKSFDEVPDGTRFVVLVLEQAGSYMGREVAMDLHKAPNVTFRHSFSDNTALISALQIGEIPAVVIVERNHTDVITKDINSRRELKVKITNYLETKGIKIDDEVDETDDEDSADPDDKYQQRTVLRHHVKRMGDVVFQIDLESALRYSLQQEVATVKVITGDQLKALQDYLKVVLKYFPFVLNSTLTTSLKNLTVAEQILGDDVFNLLIDGKFSSPQIYLACEGSQRQYRGYPCSLWKLFHFFTVNSALLNVGNKRANPREVLDAMHGYVKYFFGCRDCSKHFQEMAAERKLTEVATLEGAILWLWEAHNVVNNRVKGDATEDPEYPKIQLPSASLCPCTSPDGTWKTDEVLKYLKNMYSKYNVRYIGSDTKLLFAGLD